MYADNCLLELEPVQTLSDGGIHLVQSCSACSGRGYVIHEGNKNRCVRCSGTGVAGKQAMGHRFATVLESGPGYWFKRNEFNRRVYHALYPEQHDSEQVPDGQLLAHLSKRIHGQGK